MAEKYCLKETWMRLFTAVMCFLVLFSMQSMRLNMSVAIVCMINHTALSDITFTNNTAKNMSISEYDVSNEGKPIVKIENTDTLQGNKTKDVQDNCNGGNKTEEQREDGPFRWTKTQQGLILNAYFWGYVIFTIPCGWVANRCSSVRILTISTALSSILCLLIPVAASHGHVAVIVLRALTGSLAGLFHPSVQNLLAQWLPPSQVASIGSFAFSGATCGTIVTFIFTGFMCKYGFAGGWPSVFYVNGSFCMAVAVCWLFLVREYPPTTSSTAHGKQRPCVGKGSSDDTKTKKVPWKSILTSKPVYAVFVCTAAIDSYGTVTTLYLPTYFADIMNFSIVSNGTLSSLPYVFKSIVQFFGGFISDFLRRKTSLSVGTLRKLIVGTGKIVCAVAIIVIGFMTCDQQTLAVVLMVTSLAATGFMEMGVGINLIDIAGSYAGLILSISSFISHTVGLAAASVTAVITSQNPNRKSWQLVFMMSALIVIFALILYVCLASGRRQSWAGSPERDFDRTKNQMVELEVPLYEQKSVPVDTCATNYENNLETTPGNQPNSL